MATTTKTVEITVSVSGKIPRRSYENFSPTFVIKEIIPGSISDSARLSRQKQLYDEIHKLFNSQRDAIRLEEIQDQFKNLRFTINPKDGKKYPHVTDILYWDADFYISPEQLAQYGARGSGVHRMIDGYISRLPDKKWDLTDIAKRDAILLKNGSLKLWDTLGDINFLGFMEKYGKDIEFGDGEFQAFNAEHFYCGRPDRVGKYLGIPTIFDWKCRAGHEDDFKQMAMYCHLDDPRLKEIKQMVIVPLNPKNVSGFGKPMVSDELGKHFGLALRDRMDYRDKFGI